MGGTLDQHQWIAVLKSVGAFEAFRKANRFGITPGKVVSFLVRNPAFPASICYAVTRVDRALRQIGGSKGQPAVNRAERLVGRLRADLSFITTDEIIDAGPAPVSGSGPDPVHRDRQRHLRGVSALLTPRAGVSWKYHALLLCRRCLATVLCGLCF